MNFTAAQLEQYRKDVLELKQPLENWYFNVILGSAYGILPKGVTVISWHSPDFSEKGYRYRYEHTLPEGYGPNIADPTGELNPGDTMVMYFDMVNKEYIKKNV